MTDEVDEIKAKTDIVSIIGEHVELKKAGRNFKGLCPFHSEKTPSFIVSPEMQIFKCFGCFPSGQFVKTPFGYHKIEEIVDGEFVVSGNGNLRRVLATHERDYEGKLLRVKLSQLTETVCLTEDHFVYVVGGASLYANHYKYLSKRLNSYRNYPKQERLQKIGIFFPIKKVKAGKLKKGMTLLYPIDQIISDIKELDLSSYITKVWPHHGTKPLTPPLDIKVDTNFLKLIGYYIAEGSNHRAYIRFSLGNHEEDFAGEIVELVYKLFNLDAKIYRRPTTRKTGLEITVCNSILANIFENLCGKGASQKRIPFVLQQLPPSKQLVLLRAILKGDGSVSFGKKAKTKREAITTVSRTLSEQVTDILLRAGYFPSRTVSKEKYDGLHVYHKEAITVSWSKDPSASKFHHIYETSDGFAYWLLPILKTAEDNFSGKVYNLTVEKEHSYVANTFAVANCGEAGDVFSFLEKYEGMDFYESLKFLAQKAGIKLKPRFNEKSDKEKLYTINQLAAKFYHWVLLNHPQGKDALNYLKTERGLTLTTIQTFQIGFSPDVPFAFKKFLVDKKKISVRDLERAGLVYTRDGRTYDRFRGRIIFPLVDHRGNIVGFAGRIIPGKAQEGVAKYINTPETDIYHKSKTLFALNLTKSEIKKEKNAIVVEGELDAISSWQVGVKNIVAVKGSSLTEEQVRLLARFTDTLTLAMDADFAGDAAARRGIEIAEGSGLEIRVARLRGFKDPDEAARKDSSALKDSLSNALGVWDFVVDSVFERYKGASGQSKGRISRELVPVLSAIQDKIVQAHYINIVARRLNVPVEAVDDQIKKTFKGNEPKIVTETFVKPKAKERYELLEDRLLAVAFHFDPSILLTRKIQKLIITPLAQRIVTEFKTYSEKHKDFDLSIFASSLPKELVDAFIDIALKDTGLEDETEERLQDELDLIIREIKMLSTKRYLTQIGKLINKYEISGEKEKLKKAQQEFGELSKKLTELEDGNFKGIIL